MTEWNAAAYAQHSSLQEAMADEVLRNLTLAGSERILDLGCGDGRITAALAVRVPEGSVLGVDPSLSMIEFASRQFAPPQYDNLRFEQADARSLSFHGEFDLVVSFNALHWVPEQTMALQRIRRALKPSGRAVLRFVSQGERTSLEDVIEETRRQSKWSASFSGFQKPYVHFTPEQYEDLAQQCGLQVVKLQVEDKAWDFRNRDAFVAFARATFVEWTQHLPESERITFITDVLDRYQQIAARDTSEMNTFKFYQMEVALAPVT